jgi:HSP20 family protein
MTETATASDQDRETLDHAIEQIENLYRSVTGRDVPSPADEPSASIPPERAPEQYVAEQVDRLIDALGAITAGPATSPGWSPPLVVWEGPGEIVIRLDLPGVPKESAHVSAGRGLLEVSGRRAVQAAGEHRPLQLRHVESWSGEFRRSIPLPPDVDVNRLEARLQDGVLELTVPRQNRSSEFRSVPVA